MNGNNLCESARIKAMLLQEQINKKVLVDKEIFSQLQGEICGANKIIEKLKEDKGKLKVALSEAVSKRDTHYKQYLHYKDLYETLKAKGKHSPSEKISNLDKEHESILYKNKLGNRDKKIQELYAEIQRLEKVNLKMEVESCSWKELYNACKYINNESEAIKSPNFSSQLANVTLRIIKKVKLDKSMHHLFKEICISPKYFLKLLDQKILDEALLKILTFFELVLNNYKIESTVQRTPSFSPHFHLMNKSEESSSSYSPQVSIINPEINFSNELSMQLKPKSEEKSNSKEHSQQTKGKIEAKDTSNTRSQQIKPKAGAKVHINEHTQQGRVKIDEHSNGLRKGNIRAPRIAIKKKSESDISLTGYV